MKKRASIILILVLVLVLAAVAMPCTAFAADEHSAENHNHEGWTAWGDQESEQTSLPTEDGQYYLTKDITLSSTCVLRNKTIELCLNGHTVRLAAESGAVIDLQENTSLYLYDCGTNERYFRCMNGKAWKDAGTEAPIGTVIPLEKYDINTADGTFVQTVGGCITGGKAAGINLSDYRTSYLYIYGGNIIGNTNEENGGGIAVKDGQIVMCGGSIAGNYSNSCGGGIGSTLSELHNFGVFYNFQLEGGCITGNTAAQYGGGVSGYPGSETILSGVFLINGNRTSTYGGGIYTAGKLTVQGGTVQGNRADKWGGGLYSNSTGVIFMSDGLVTENKAAHGGGVYNNNKMTLSGGTITENTASGNGGGIRIGNTDDKTGPRKLTVTGGTISNNYAGNGGGGIYVGTSAVLTASDLKLSGNRANKYGGGINIDTEGSVEYIGGSITSNTAGTDGGGISWACDTVTLGGSVNITDNKVRDKNSNVLIRSGSWINIGDGADALKDGAKIGISLLTPEEGNNSYRRFTANGSKSDQKFFISDDTSRSYGAFYNENGYLDIAVLHLHYDADGNEINFDEWTDPSSLPKDGGAWFLGTDVTLRRDWEPTADTKLCLNGHVISTNNECCLWLEEVNLDIFDEEDSAVHYFEYRKGNAWSYVGNSSSENAVNLTGFSFDTISDGDIIAVPGGVITGGNMCLHLYSDVADTPQVSVNMFGGNIVGISSNYAEPLNIVGDVEFTMYGGSIAGNFFSYGDILSNRNGSMALLGGSITGNIASKAVVYSSSFTDLSIAGSTMIHDNISQNGAVFAENNDITVGGSAQIRGNVTSKGIAKNLYLPSGRKLLLTAPEQGMSIGVTAQDVPKANTPIRLTDTASESDAARFFSDSEYAVAFKPTDSSSDALYLTVNSGLASVFGGSSIWLVAILAAIVLAGIIAVVIVNKKKQRTK